MTLPVYRFIFDARFLQTHRIKVRFRPTNAVDECRWRVPIHLSNSLSVRTLDETQVECGAEVAPSQKFAHGVDWVPLAGRLVERLVCSLDDFAPVPECG